MFIIYYYCLLVYYYLFVYSGSKKLLQDKECCRWMIYVCRAYAKLDLNSHKHKTWWAKLFFCSSLGSDSSNREFRQSSSLSSNQTLNLPWCLERNSFHTSNLYSKQSILAVNHRRVLDKTIYYVPAPGSVWVRLGRPAPDRTFFTKMFYETFFFVFAVEHTN